MPHRLTRAYSNDLRERVAASVVAGRSCRETALVFGVSVASAVKWSQGLRATGSAAARPMGHRQPRSLAPELDWLMARLASTAVDPINRCLNCGGVVGSPPADIRRIAVRAEALEGRDFGCLPARLRGRGGEAYGSSRERHRTGADLSAGHCH